MKLWEVQYGNYDPAEVDSTHASQEEAEKRLAELKSGFRESLQPWHIVELSVGPPTLTELLKEVAEHGETEAGKGHGFNCVCMDNPAREIRKLIMAALTSARKEPLTPEEIEQAMSEGDPNPERFRYLPGECERALDQRFRVKNVLRMAESRL